jgi:hypothetical protein
MAAMKSDASLTPALFSTLTVTALPPGTALRSKTVMSL